MAEKNAMLVMRDVSKTFNPGTVNEKCALKNLNLTLKQGDFATIVGSNGAGKSTLFNAITGAFFADKGLIMLDGEDITYQKEHVRSKVIGHLFQDPLKGTAPHMTIEENMALAYLRTTTSKNAYFSRIKAADKKKFREQLALLDMGLEDRMKQPVGLLSGGQRQALTLLMATMVTPKILLLDEPTSFLDAKGKAELMTILQTLAHEKNVAIIVTLHELELAQKLADAVVCVAPSGVSGVLTPQEAFAEQNIRRLFDLTAEQYAMLFKNGDTKPKFAHYIRSGQKLLRCGYTTGTCAALGAAGAARLLLTGHVPESVGLRTPKGIVVEVAPQFCRPTADGAECAIVKDGGDDIDATTGLPVVAEVTLLPDAPHTVTIDGGAGVGRVTKPGLDQPVGAAAINHVPRQMITEALLREADAVGYGGGFAVTVSIKGGAAAAKRTFNPHIGVEGGLSVLGTSGIVEPMSQQALLDTLQIEIHQAALKSRRLILAPGNYGLDYLAAHMPELARIPVVKISNFVGEALDMVATEHFAEVLLVGHVGKLVKLAGGIMNTHSKQADCRTELFCAHAALCGADAATCRALMDAATTDACLEILDAANLREPVVASLLDAIQTHIDRRAAEAFRVGAVLFSNQAGPLGQTKTADTLLKTWKGA